MFPERMTALPCMYYLFQGYNLQDRNTLGRYRLHLCFLCRLFPVMCILKGRNMSDRYKIHFRFLRKWCLVMYSLSDINTYRYRQFVLSRYTRRHTRLVYGNTCRSGCHSIYKYMYQSRISKITYHMSRELRSGRMPCMYFDSDRMSRCLDRYSFAWR